MKIDFLAGYKTYVTAAVTVLGTLAAMSVGDVALADGVQLIVTALLAAFVRSGVATANDK